MALVPGPDFDRESYLAGIAVPMTATVPLSINPLTNVLSVATATTGIGGVVSAAAQSFSGVKTFLSVPVCAIAPTSDSSLVNQAYVNNAVTMNQAWQQPIIEQYDFTPGDPAGVADGDRYISSTTVGAFVATYIYQRSGATWIEIVPHESWVVFDTALDRPFLYTSLGTWSPMGTSLHHGDLYELLDDDHTQYVKVSGRIADAVTIPNTTASTTIATGALTIAGGLGISKNICCGAEMRVFDITTPFTAYSRLWQNGTTTYLDCSAASRTLDIAANFSQVKLNSTTDNDLTTGALVSSGGISCAKRLCVGNTIRLHDTITPADYAYLIRTGGGTSVKSSTTGALLKLSDDYTYFQVQGTTSSTSPSNGAIITPGGLGVSKNACIGAEMRVFDITTPFTAYSRLWQNGTSTYLDCSAASRTLDVSTNFSQVKLNSTTACTSAATGALVCAGGLGVAGNIFTDGSITAASYNNVIETTHTTKLRDTSGDLSADYVLRLKKTGNIVVCYLPLMEHTMGADGLPYTYSVIPAAYASTAPYSWVPIILSVDGGTTYGVGGLEIDTNIIRFSPATRAGFATGTVVKISQSTVTWYV